MSTNTNKTLKDFHIGQPFFCQDIECLGGFHEITIHGTYVKDAILNGKQLTIIQENNYP